MSLLFCSSIIGVHSFGTLLLLCAALFILFYEYRLERALLFSFIILSYCVSIYILCSLLYIPISSFSQNSFSHNLQVLKYVDQTIFLALCTPISMSILSCVALFGRHMLSLIVLLYIYLKVLNMDPLSSITFFLS